MLLKIQCNLKSRFYKHNAVKFLDGAFGEMLDGDKFIRWLAKSLDHKTFGRNKFQKTIMRNEISTKNPF